MSYIIDKFKGRYRILAPIDESTMDFPRNLKGGYEDVDCYISCQNKIKVTYYGSRILQAYIPSIGRGNNIVKAICEINPVLIFDIRRADEEITFKFKYADSDTVLPLLKPRTIGADISPFSSKNLPKNDYKIPDENLNEYRAKVAAIPPEKVLTISHITNNFIKSLATKKCPYEKIKADMKLKCLKGKEYIHATGQWEKFMIYLDKELEEIL